jgi:uncharacterized membrane-anchored protein YhcB (DUF1043 family)
MQDAAIFQSALQPLTKLTQANMDLVTKFAGSPEVTSQAINDAQKLFQQAQESAMKLAHSQAFAGLMQGFMENYTEFLTEMSQSATAIFSQGHAAFMKQANEATSNVVEATHSGARRLRHAA